jgi:hypothetical protein
MTTTTPTFSIVIPTRERADTLRCALPTALNQTFRDIEVIVQESGDDANVASALAEVHDPRVHAFKTGEPVRMTENWERALDHARGEYVFFMGDDDGLLPDACAIADNFFRQHDSEILSWFFAHYYWPLCVEQANRCRLRAMYGNDLAFAFINSQAALRATYRFHRHHAEMPMLYNSFVSRKLIERVRAKHGRYFFGSAPDIVSGVVNAYSTQRYGRCNRPLSIAGMSHHSTGMRVGRSGDPEVRRTAYAAAFGEVFVHPTMVESPSQPLGIGNEFLMAKEAMFPDQAPTLSYLDMLWAAAQTINFVPAQYDEVKDNIRSICSKNDIPVDKIPIPHPVSNDRLQVKPSYQGVKSVSPDVTTADVGAIENVFDATLQLARLIPPGVVAAKDPVVVTPIEKIPLTGTRPFTIAFCTNGGAELFLGLGWYVTEPWGVYSLGPRAELALPFDQSVDTVLKLRIEGFGFVTPVRPTLTIVVKSGAEALGHLEIKLEDPAVALDLAPVNVASLGATRTLNLVIEIDAPSSQVRDGVGNDAREIGLGLQRVIVS